jgi:hypothetical protein
MLSSIAFWICFLTRPVASGLRVLYKRSCFESRMENLSEATLAWTDLTLNTDVWSLEEDTSCHVYVDTLAAEDEVGETRVPELGETGLLV